MAMFVAAIAAIKQLLIVQILSNRATIHLNLELFFQPLPQIQLNQNACHLSFHGNLEGHIRFQEGSHNAPDSLEDIYIPQLWGKIWEAHPYRNLP